MGYGAFAINQPPAYSAMLTAWVLQGGVLAMPSIRGGPKVEADFNTLLSYSPYHNVRAGKPYPAILATTGEADDRVVPAHSYKYVAALQATHLGPKPRLIRIDARAGHGLGKPAAQAIEEAADMWAFAARWTGLVAKETK